METQESAHNPKFDELRGRTEEYVRDEPMKAVGYAALAGVILTIFPIFRLSFAVVRAALCLLRPALFVLGGIKAYEEIQKRYSE